MEDEKLIDYVERFVKRHKNKSIHPIDVSRLMSALGTYSDNKKNAKAKEKVLEKLEDNECNYFCVVTEKNLGTDDDIKVYGVRSESLEEAYDMCEDIIDNNTEFNFILTKEQFDRMIYIYNNEVIKQK